MGEAKLSESVWFGDLGFFFGAPSAGWCCLTCLGLALASSSVPQRQSSHLPVISDAVTPTLTPFKCKANHPLLSFFPPPQ